MEREFYLHLLGHDVIIPGVHPRVPVRRAHARACRSDHRGLQAVVPGPAGRRIVLMRCQWRYLTASELAPLAVAA